MAPLKALERSFKVRKAASSRRRGHAAIRTETPSEAPRSEGLSAPAVGHGRCFLLARKARPRPENLNYSIRCDERFRDLYGRPEHRGVQELWRHSCASIGSSEDLGWPTVVAYRKAQAGRPALGASAPEACHLPNESVARHSEGPAVGMVMNVAVPLQELARQAEAPGGDWKAEEFSLGPS